MRSIIVLGGFLFLYSLLQPYSDSCLCLVWNHTEGVFSSFFYRFAVFILHDVSAFTQFPEKKRLYFASYEKNMSANSALFNSSQFYMSEVNKPDKSLSHVHNQMFHAKIERKICLIISRNETNQKKSSFPTADMIYELPNMSTRFSRGLPGYSSGFSREHKIGSVYWEMNDLSVKTSFAFK